MSDPVRPRHLLGAGLLLAAVLFVQVAIATAVTFRAPADREFRWTTGFFAQQADAFLHGRSDLRHDPPAALALLADPYDPNQRFPFNAMLDASYFGGRYYLYFGPVPALFLVLVAPVVAIRDLPDAALALPFAAGLTFSCTAVIWLLWRRLVPFVPEGYPAAALLVAGLGFPLPSLFSHPAVYEVAILAGSAFLVSGLAFAIVALRRPGWWFAAGAAWALALGSRVSLLPAVLLLAGGALVLAVRTRRIWPALGVAVPLTAGLAALGWYNWARFGAPLETGHRYQLAGFDLAGRYDQFFGADYLVPNLALLLAQPPVLLARFPFLAPAGLAGSPFGAFPLPPDLRVEPLVGLLVANPFVLLGPVGLLALWRLRAKLSVVGVVAAGLALLTAAAALPDLLQRYTTTRYLADFASLAVLLAFLGTAGLRSWARRVRLVDGLVAILAALAVGAGVLLGVQGRYEILSRHNPALMAALGGNPPVRALAEDGTVFASLDARVGEALLGGYRFEPEAVPAGGTTALVLWWRPGPDDLTGRLRLVASGFRPVAERPIVLPAAGPPLDAGEWRESRFAIDLPIDTPAPGYLMAEIAIDGATPVLAGPLRVRRDTRWPPEGAEPLDLRFGSDLILDGIRLERYPTEIGLFLYWRAGWSGGLRWQDRQVTLELVDSAGRVVSRTTGDPGEGWYRTSLWQPGDRILDERDLALPPGLPPGEYAVRLSVSSPGGPVAPLGDPIVARLRLP
ncbi:MAG: hypothetical protein U0556_10125 [Dehalococcoidia bacterium]